MPDFKTGIEYVKLSGYTIYQFKSKYGYNYFLSIPDQYVKNYQMFVGFPKKDLKELSKKDVINEIDEIKKMIASLNKDGIYLLPDIPVSELDEAARENDGKKYNKILSEKINPIIAEVYKTLSSYSTAQQIINQVIIFVKQTESDRKFIDWIEINIPNFIHGVTYEEIKKFYYQQLSQEIGAIKKEEIFENPSKYKNEVIESKNHEEHKSKHTKENIKVKKLIPSSNHNNYGFSNVFKLLLTLTVIIGLSIIIRNLILK